MPFLRTHNHTTPQPQHIMDYVVFSSDGSVNVQSCERGDEYGPILKIFATGNDDDDDRYSRKTIARFTKQDIKQAQLDRVFTDLLCGNGFCLCVCTDPHSRSRHRRGVFQENKYLADRGWSGVYGPVAIGAQIDDGCEHVKIPALIALQMTKIILESKGKSVDSIFSDAGVEAVKVAAWRAEWISSQKATAAVEAVVDAEAKVEEAKTKAVEAKAKAGAASEWLAQAQEGKEGLVLALKTKAVAEEEENAGEKAEEASAAVRQKEKLLRYLGSLTGKIMGGGALKFGRFCGQSTLGASGR